MIYLIFILINLATFIYLIVRLENAKGWIVFFPVCMVFGFMIAFIMIYDAFERNGYDIDN